MPVLVAATSVPLVGATASDVTGPDPANGPDFCQVCPASVEVYRTPWAPLADGQSR